MLLGTGGGPIVLSGDRMGISTAVVYGNNVYVVDLGHGAAVQLLRSGLLGDPSAPANVRGIFFTHMHSDHTVEWPALYTTAQINLLRARSGEPFRVFGPGDRPVPPRTFPPDRPAPGPVNPGGPISGISAMTGYLRQAFAADYSGKLIVGQDLMQLGVGTRPGR
ncbi:MBL fold metallo-hydrolase [Actinomadura soli]|uniref:MBL fold metallo-hydrolase n=1 Tax=Actinomadura soli TaxID=2508997 RepID=A0A5C4JJY4_9ACTN|nr:MBL fold metallo-hydrolase [Actinomadura soli]